MTMKTPFEKAVVAHAATVLRVCRAVLGPHTDADDAWSETFLAALKAWPTLADHTNVEAWLVTVAHRKAIDIIRARQRQAIPVEHLPEPESTIGNPEAASLDLWAEVAKLPDRQRQAVAYHYLGGLPHAEVAAVLGGTAEAARKAASDGIRALRTSRLAEDHRSKGSNNELHR